MKSSIIKISLLLFFSVTLMVTAKAQFNKGDEVTVSFENSVYYGSQKNDLSVHVSSDFNGKADFASVKFANWEDVTSLFEYSDSKENKQSGVKSLSQYVQKGKPLYVAFKYTGKATPKPTQRMWIIKSFTAQKDGKKLKTSDAMFVSNPKNDENVTWDVWGKGGSFRSRSNMTKNASESWAIIEVKP